MVCPKIIIHRNIGFAKKLNQLLLITANQIKLYQENNKEQTSPKQHQQQQHWKQQQK